jgi:cellulose synthase/poly-beta-1,6-N-acetylglucosamine synthase-like glycosyltransferase
MDTNSDFSYTDRPNEGALLPSVSVVIPVYNGSDTIRLCMEAVCHQHYPKERLEVLVVDNNSTDGTPSIVNEYPVALLFERQLQGPHAATNKALQVAQGEIIAFTDSDCVPAPDWLRLLVAPFEDDQVVGVGGRIEAYKPESVTERFLQSARPLRNTVQMPVSFPRPIVTANAAYRACALRSVGFFDGNMYTAADIDLSWRIQWATKKKAVYAPDAVVYHKFSPSVRKLFRHYWIYGLSEIMLATLYKEVANYPRPPRRHMQILVEQSCVLLRYVAWLLKRMAVSAIRTADEDFLMIPALTFVAEVGNICGKLEGIWETRFFRRLFWKEPSNSALPADTLQ